MKSLGHVLAAAVISTGLFADFAANAAAPSDSASAPAAAVIEMVVAKGRVVSGPSVVKVTQGDRVRLGVTVDAADELHLHGYNLHLNLKPGQRAQLDFVAGKSGRFTYELHHADLELGAIEVYPR
jgi:plastocyanin